MLMNRRDFLVKGGVVVGTSLIPNTALAVFGSSVRGTMGAAGAAGAGAPRQEPDARTLHREGQDLGGQPAEPGGDANGADQQAADRHQTAGRAL